MTSTSSHPTTEAGVSPTLRLARWTVTSGSNAQSRGAVVITAGDDRWEASAEGNGPIDALYRAVDRATADILAGHPRLLAYDIHALSEGPDAEGEVRVRIAPPAAAAIAARARRHRDQHMACIAQRRGNIGRGLRAVEDVDGETIRLEDIENIDDLGLDEDDDLDLDNFRPGY